MILRKSDMSRGLWVKVAALSAFTLLLEMIAFIACICIVAWLFNLPVPRDESPRYGATALCFFTAFIAWQLTCWPIRALGKKIKMRWLYAAVGKPQ